MSRGHCRAESFPSAYGLNEPYEIADIQPLWHAGIKMGVVPPGTESQGDPAWGREKNQRFPRTILIPHE